MSGRPVITTLGVVAAGGIGYYLYQAGGNPKSAEKRAEADAHRLSARIRSNTPGDNGEIAHSGQAIAADVGAKLDQFDQAAYDAAKKLREAKEEASEITHKAAVEANHAVDKFDKTVEQAAAKAKSGLSSWFK